LVSGVFVEPGRSLEGDGGHCSGLSTATARWRRRGRFWTRRGGVARGGGSSARQQEGEELVRDAWAPAHGGVMAGKAGKALHGGAVGGRRREAEQGGEEGDKGDFAISKSSRD
jgi:hypothetical protein